MVFISMKHVVFSTLLAPQAIFFKGGSSTTNQPFVAWCLRPPNPPSFQVWRSGREEAIRPSGHFLQKRVEKDHMDHESRWFADLPIFPFFFTAIRLSEVGVVRHAWMKNSSWLMATTPACSQNKGQQHWCNHTEPWLSWSVFTCFQENEDNNH